jgi:hypothetical protein
MDDDTASIMRQALGLGEVALRRALLVGWADRVARRVKPAEQAALHSAAENDPVRRCKLTGPKLVLKASTASANEAGI